MWQTRGKTPMFILSLIGYMLICINSAAAQNACDSNNTIVITFPELDPPGIPSGTEYTKAVLTNGVAPLSVIIDKDPQDTAYLYPFDTYFFGYFNPITKNYEVTMIAGINRDGNNFGTDDDVNELQYLLRCVDQSDPQVSVFKVLKIQILDVNDNTPQLVNAPYIVNVNERTPVGVTVFRGISANDNDEGPNKQITYSLSYTVPSPYNFNGTQFFTLPSEAEGLVSVSAPLDFETMYRQTGDASLTFYTITVTARDNAVNLTQRRSNTTTLTVKIIDGDDQGPEFVYPTCTTSSQIYGKSCIRPKYLTTVPAANSSQISLVFLPDPSDPNNLNGTVDIIMQDKDTLNNPITCAIRATDPAGFESYFTATSTFAGGKKYRCSITKIAGQSLYSTNFNQWELVVENPYVHF